MKTGERNLKVIEWFCPKCNTLIKNKRFNVGSEKGLISCNCHPIGKDICLYDGVPNLYNNINWYKKTIELQKNWKRVYILKEE